MAEKQRRGEPSPEAEAALEALKKLFESRPRGRRPDLRWCYDVGRQLLGVTPRRGKADYRHGSLEGLAERFGVGRDLLFRARRFAEVYSPEEAEKLFAGGKMTWDKLATLLVLKGEKDRRSLQERVLAEGLSVRRLRAAVVDRLRRRPAKRPRRKAAGLVGAGLASRLWGLVLETDRWNRHVEAWLTGGRGPRGKLGERLRKLLNEARQALDGLEGNAAALREKLDQLLA